MNKWWKACERGVEKMRKNQIFEFYSTVTLSTSQRSLADRYNTSRRTESPSREEAQKQTHPHTMTAVPQLIICILLGIKALDRLVDESNNLVHLSK